MPNKAVHPSKKQRSLGPVGPGSKPPTVGPAPQNQVPPEREVIKQAQRDVEAGIKDTSRRTLRDDVPGGTTDAEHTPGAQVPPGGLDRNKSGMR